MNTAELKEKTVSELEEIERDTRRQLWQARFENYSNQLDDTASIRRLKRQVARVKTVLSQRKSEES